jgi:iron complex transport system permease protein
MSLLRKSSTPLVSGYTLLIFAVLSLLCLLSMLFSISVGSVDISMQQVMAALFDNNGTIESSVILELRLPRVIAGFLVGGMLALAGALMQVLLRNPLAEPYVLGVSGGASVFALLAMMLGLSGYWLNLGAFTGAFASIFMVFGLSHMGGSWNPMRVLLTGVVIAAGWGALINFLLAVSPAAKLHGMLFWLMGDLGYADHSGFAALVLLAVTLVSLLLARDLNLLTHGDQQAASLGVSVRQLRYMIYFLSSLLTATAVMQAGGIGFIGLIIPHLVRLLFGSEHRLLIPVSVLLGGCLLVIADGLARIMIAPQQLPVGVLTALLGVPLFLVLLHSNVVRQKP